MDSKLIKQKKKVLEAGRVAVDELTKVLESIVIKLDNGEEDTVLAADKMKNAAAAKKLAFTDALDILQRIEEEEELIEEALNNEGKDESKGGFAERRAGK